ncbi:hypothetical protein A2U01_0020121, partial [Trifolium medium]|nr:hypothetical protein [Trifolium medium]
MPPKLPPKGRKFESGHKKRNRNLYRQVCMKMFTSTTTQLFGAPRSTGRITYGVLSVANRRCVRTAGIEAASDLMKANIARKEIAVVS